MSSLPKPGLSPAVRALLLTLLLAGGVGFLAELVISRPVEAAAPESTPWIHTRVPAHLGFQLYWWDGFTAERDASVTGYEVQFRETGAASWTSHPHSGTVRAVEISNLAVGKQYQVRVRATNSDGSGPWSDVENIPGVVSYATVVNPPFPVIVEAGDARARVSWGRPSHTGGRTLTGYVVRLFDVDSSTVLRSIKISGATTTSTLITGLTYYTDYTIDMYATYGERDDGGLPTARLEFTPQLPAAAPTAVASLFVQEGNKRLRLSWGVPDGTVTGYDVEYKASTDPDTEWKAFRTRIVSIGALRHQTIFGLDNGTAYDVRVRGVNPTGDGSWSSGTGTPTPKPNIFLSAPPGVPEGSSVTVAVLLSEPLSGDVTIPLTITDDTAEPGDHGTLRSITIRAGQTWAERAITTARDADPDHDTFTVAVATDSRLPTSVFAGYSSWARITIEDLDAPKVALSFPHPPAPSQWSTGVATVNDGDSVEMKATLSMPLDRDLTIPLEYKRNYAEREDYQPLSGITIKAGDTCGIGVLNTNDDADPDDETLVILLARLTPVVQKGYPAALHITIKENDKANTAHRFPANQRTGCPGMQEAPPSAVPVTSVSLALGQDRVREDAGQVTLTATLNAPAPDGGLELRLYAANESTAEKGVDYTLPESIAIPAGGLSASAQVRVTDDALDESDETAVIGVIADTLDATLTADTTLTIEDDDGAQQQQESPRDYSDLIAQMYEWRNGPEAQQYGKPHTDRWDRALLAFGETVADASITPMTAAEAQALADQDWGARWVPVAAALWEIENRAPTVAAAIGDATIVNQSGTRQVSLSGVFADADNDNLTITAASSDEAVAMVSVASDYSSLTVTAQARGTATITVTANDGKRGTVSDEFTVTVKAAPVVASALADLTGLEVGATQEVSLSGVFSDADGDSLTITAASSDDAVATVTVAADQSTLTVAGVAEGTATITVTARDADGNRVADEFAAPVARKYAALIAQMYEWRNGPEVQQYGKLHTERWDRALLAFGETVADASITPMTAAQAQALADQSWGTRWVPVAAALWEIENQAPTVASAIADATIVNQSGTHRVSLAGVFSDADNDALTVTAASSDTAVAAVSVASDYSSLTVTAQARGTATITVTAADGKSGTVQDEFTVTVKAAPTVASALADVSLEELEIKDISLSGVFSDADGDALDATAASSDDFLVSAFAIRDLLTVMAVSAGTATITVTVQDSDGNQVSDQFDVTVGTPQQDPPPNQAPTVANALADETIVNESGTRQVSMSGTFSDADNDSLTVTAASGDEAVATVSVASDYSSLMVSAQARGTAIITVTADDGNGGTVSDSFTVMVKAAPVVASAISDMSGLEAGSTRDVSLAGVFSDADGDSLTVTAASSDDAVATVTVAADGSRLTLTGVAEGTATITVTAQDTDGNRVSDAFDVSVVRAPEPDEPEPPTGAPVVAAPLADISLEAPEYGEFDLDDVFRDPDGGELTFSATSSNYGVASMWVAGSTLTVVGTGMGTATITVTAEDPDGNRVSDEFEVSVRPAS